MSRFLTAEEIEDLTGYTQPARQSKHLATQGISHSRRRGGVVRVTWEQVNRPAGRVERQRPNLEAARG